MTIEEILNCSIETLEAMSDEQLMEHFKPILCVTRPELAITNKESNTRTMRPSNGVSAKRMQQMELDKRLAMAKEIAAKMGIKL